MYKLIIVLQSGERIELGDRFHSIEEADRTGYRILQESRYADYFEVARATGEVYGLDNRSCVYHDEGVVYESK